MTYKIKILRGDKIGPLTYKKSTLPEARRRLDSALEDQGMHPDAYSWDEATRTFTIDASRRYPE